MGKHTCKTNVNVLQESQRRLGAGEIILRLPCVRCTVNEGVLMLVSLRTGMTGARERTKRCRIERAKEKPLNNEFDLEV